jgi:hypothetical protein
LITSLITNWLLRQVDLITSLITNWLLVDLITSLITNWLLVDLITSLITNWLLLDLITSLITNWLLRQVDGQKVWVVKDVKLEPMCGGEGQQRDESPHQDLSRSNQAPYRASRGQPVGPLPAPRLRDAQDGALQQAGDARDGAQRRRQRVSSLVTSPRMRNLIR